MCLLLQSSSKLCSLNPAYVWHPFSWLLQLARPYERCSGRRIGFKSGPLCFTTHCLPWAYHRGVAFFQPAALCAAHHHPHPPPPPGCPVAGEQSWLPTADPAAPAGLPRQDTWLYKRDFTILIPEEKNSHFWCLPFPTSFQWVRTAGARAGIRASRPLAGNGQSCRTSQTLQKSMENFFLFFFFFKSLCFPWFPMETGFIQTLSLCAPSLLHILSKSGAWFQVNLTEVQGFHNRCL